MMFVGLQIKVVKKDGEECERLKQENVELQDVSKSLFETVERLKKELKEKDEKLNQVTLSLDKSLSAQQLDGIKKSDRRKMTESIISKPESRNHHLRGFTKSSFEVSEELDSGFMNKSR